MRCLLRDSVRLALLVLTLAANVRVAAADMSYPLPYPWEDSMDEQKTSKNLQNYIGYVKQNPSDYTGREILSHVCFAAWRLEHKDNRRRVEIAKTLLRNAQVMVQLDPKRAEGYHWVGAAIAMIGLTRGVLNSLQLVPEARKNFEKSSEIDPNYMSGSALVQMARIYTMLPSFPISIGDREKALKNLIRAKEISGSFTLTNLYLADLLWSLGKNKEALAELELIGKLKPKSEPEFFLNFVNKNKAAELRRLITSGAKRDPFYDVLSDIQPGLVD